MVVVIFGWVAATPLTLRHPRVVQRVGFALIGPAQRLFEHLDATPGEYTERDISPYFWHNGQYPDSAEYQALSAGNLADRSSFYAGLIPAACALHCRPRWSDRLNPGPGRGVEELLVRTTVPG
jgi:methionine sulfoxide reductase catalytic subunit